jgi:hypothetical protein
MAPSRSRRGLVDPEERVIALKFLLHLVDDLLQR